MNKVFLFFAFVLLMSCKTVHHHVEKYNALEISYKVKSKNDFVCVKFRNTSNEDIYFSPDFIAGEIFDKSEGDNDIVSSENINIKRVYHDNTYHTSSISYPIGIVKLRANKILKKEFRFEGEVREMSIVFGFFTSINECRKQLNGIITKRNGMNFGHMWGQKPSQGGLGT